VKVVVQDDAQVHPCIAQPRHPWLEKPPELQPSHQITLTSHSLTVSEKSKARTRAVAKLY